MDVADREGAEEALRASKRFRTLLQFSFDVYWDRRAASLHPPGFFGGPDLADAPARGLEIGKTRWEVPCLEPDEEAWRKHRATLDAHLPFRDFELARPTPDGGKRYVSVSGLPVFDGTGRFMGYLGSDGTSPTGSARRRLSGRARHISPRLSGCDCWRHARQARCRTRFPDRATRRNGQASPRRRASRSRQSEESRRILRHRRRQPRRFDRTLVALVTRLDPSRANRPVLPDAVALTH